ncbi:transposable element Tc3 transposase [Trichonephila clavipes]|nr:transposable element Tc3 transposase [Trichonephila clavipes]
MSLSAIIGAVHTLSSSAATNPSNDAVEKSNLTGVFHISFFPEEKSFRVKQFPFRFQQDGATCHTARATIDLLKDSFGDRLISRFGPVNWPKRSCDLTPLDYFLWGYVKSLVYADKPQTLDHLEDNIRRVIADIRPQMLEEVIENWTSRLDYIRSSRGNPMPEIIFKIYRYETSTALKKVWLSSILHFRNVAREQKQLHTPDITCEIPNKMNRGIFGVRQIKVARRTRFQLQRNTAQEERYFSDLRIAGVENDHYSSLGTFGLWLASCGGQIEAGLLELLKSHQKYSATVWGALSVLLLIVLLGFLWSQSGNSFQPTQEESMVIQIRNHIYWNISIREER